jgi:hypothetical protein
MRRLGARQERQDCAKSARTTIKRATQPYFNLGALGAVLALLASIYHDRRLNKADFHSLNHKIKFAISDISNGFKP